MKLGFGLMRLPQTSATDPKSIDLHQMEQMVDLFIKAGGTYFDTAYPYHMGASEEALKATVVARYPRESFTVADKLPPWALETADDCQRIFNEQLQRSGAGYFDYYLLHGLNSGNLDVIESVDAYNFGLKMKSEGLIKSFGFSFHDKAEVLEKILEKYPELEFVQLQINYADWEDGETQSRLCYETAVRYGKPVVVMEPVKGGMLSSLPEDALAALKEQNPSASAVSWALRFAGSLDGVFMVLSGMSNVEQMTENLSVMDDLQTLSDGELAAIAKARACIAEAIAVPCTSCRYCVETCPQAIEIPQLLKIYNSYHLYGPQPSISGSYGMNTRGGGNAGSCVACGVCEEHCPQHIEIPAWMEKIASVFEKDAA